MIHMIPPPPPSTPGDWNSLQSEARDFFEQGVELEEMGDIDGARRCFQQAQEAIEQVPSCGDRKLRTEIVLYLGHLLVEAGDPADLLRGRELLELASEGLRSLGRVAEALDIEKKLLLLQSEGKVAEVLHQQGVLLGYLEMAERRLRKGKVRRAYQLVTTAMKAMNEWGAMHKGIKARARLIRGIARARLCKKRAEKDLSRAARYYFGQGEIAPWAEARLWEYVYCKEQKKMERAQEVLAELKQCDAELPERFQKVLAGLLRTHPREEEHVAD